MPASIKLSEIEIKLAQQMNREFVFNNALKKYKKEIDTYDIIFIDCPPSLGLLTINAFVKSTFLMVPVDASAYSHQGLYELLNSLGLLNETFKSNTTLIGVFFAKFVEKENVYKEAYKLLKEEDTRLFETVIRKSTQLEQAPYFNKTIIDYASASRAFQDYDALAHELLHRLEAYEYDFQNRQKQKQTV